MCTKNAYSKNVYIRPNSIQICVYWDKSELKLWFSWLLSYKLQTDVEMWEDRFKIGKMGTRQDTEIVWLIYSWLCQYWLEQDQSQHCWVHRLQLPGFIPAIKQAERLAITLCRFSVKSGWTNDGTSYLGISWASLSEILEFQWAFIPHIP